MTRDEVLEKLRTDDQFSVEDAAAAAGGEVVDGLWVPEPDYWVADDGNAEVSCPGVASGREAAESYVADGDWDTGEPNPSTSWIRVWAWRRAYTEWGERSEVDREQYTIPLDPPEPPCVDADHDWRSPFSVLGGIRENPGVWGHGGGVVVTEVCAHCGAYRDADSWAQDPGTGEQGLASVRYRDADDASLAWVERLIQADRASR